jgi:hypothetical protein
VSEPIVSRGDLRYHATHSAVSAVGSAMSDIGDLRVSQSIESAVIEWLLMMA